jgi:protein-S-isoprenylcysteine O-methyltransferase Ste14
MMIRLGNFFFKYRNIIFPLFFVLLVFTTRPHAGSRHLEPWRYAAGITVAFTGQFIRALTIGLAYIVRGGRNREVFAKKLVKDGIFAHCRNPLYLGNILIVIGLGIVAHSIPFYVIGIPLFIFAYLAIIKAEEHYLSGKFGQEYTEYLTTVNSLIPDLRGIVNTIKGMKFHWARLIVKEYGTTYTWIVCIIGLVLKNHYLRYRTVANDPLFTLLLGSFIFVTFLYALARYLKKSNRLVAD